MIRLLHWEYPLYCVITAVYIPILSGAVLIFTGLRIRATLRRRRDVQIRLHQNSTSALALDSVSDGRQPGAMGSRWQSYIVGGRRTLKILTFTSVAYFVFWSPYVALVVVQSIVSTFQPPPAIEFAALWSNMVPRSGSPRRMQHTLLSLARSRQFAALWLANANSAVNVFIYSSTNKQFRRECVLLASRLCCSRLSQSSPGEHQHPRRPGSVLNLSTINATPVMINYHLDR